jgi:OPA family glycerol-3-phosphate transporter-like MFS transporter
MKLDHPVFKSGAFAIVAAGIVGAFIAGYMSDWLFGHRRPPVAFIGYALIVGSLSVIMTQPSLPVLIGAFTVNSLAISMVHSMLSGTASMDFGGKRAAASAAGMFDGMQYVGGAFAGYGIGKLVDVYGWDAWAPSMIGFAAIAMFLMLILWNARPNKGSTVH